MKTITQIASIFSIALSGCVTPAVHPVRHHVESNQQPKQETNGSFSLLIYNVAGLPAIVSPSDPTKNTAVIGPLLNGYDVVLVQEDFWYHDELQPEVTHRFRSAPQDDSPTVFDLHDGLNQFSRFNFRDLRRTAWTDCEGYVSDHCDCLARKGFSSSELRLADGASVLMYNIHLDAGEDDPDVETRGRQFEQLATDIRKRGIGKTLIVAGDTNVLHSNKKDTKNFTDFLRKTGLTDSCGELECDDQRLDKILFRSSERLSLKPKSRTIPTEFVDENAKGLSDHDPVCVVFDWKNNASRSPVTTEGLARQ